MDDAKAPKAVTRKGTRAETISAAALQYARPGPKDTLLCDVCDKPCKTLGSYSDCGKWAVCLRCFGKAEAITARKGRWPTADDLARLRTAAQDKSSGSSKGER